MAAPRASSRTDAELILDDEEASLLDLVDNVLNKGVVLSGDLTIGLAQIDLIYARVSVLLCAADRILPTEGTDFLERHSQRHDTRTLRNTSRQPRKSTRPLPTTKSR